MAIKLKSKSGSKASKPKLKKGKASSGTTKVKRGPGRPKGSGTKLGKAKTTGGKRKPGRPPGSGSGPKPSDSVIQTHEARLTKAGKRLAKAASEHDKAVDEVAELVRKARSKNVPMIVIHESTGLSRQWLYKMTESAKRNGNG